MAEVLLRFVQISDTHLGEENPARLAKYSTPDALPPKMAELIRKMQANTQSQPGGAIIQSRTDVFEVARKLVGEINALPVDLDFVLHSGDVGFDPESAEEYQPIKELFSDLRFPIYYLVGNHDNTQFLQQNLSHLNDVQPTFDYEIPNDKVQIVCLDVSLFTLNDLQLQWLESRVNANDPRPLIVAMHHNPVSYNDFFGDAVILENHEAFRAILQPAKERLRGVFYGHMHMAMDTFQDGINYYCTPSTFANFDVYPGSDETNGSDVKTPPGFNLVTITTEATHVRRMHFPA